MIQNNAVKKDESARERYKKERLSSDSFSLGRNLSDAVEEGKEGQEEEEGKEGKEGEEEEEGKEGEEGQEGEEVEGGGGFNPQEEANTLAEDRERERAEMGGRERGDSQKSIKSKVESGEGEGEGEGAEGEEEEAQKEDEKITIPNEVAVFVLQWEFVFALAGPFFLFILLAEFIVLRIFSMFKFSTWKKICTLGNFLLACFTTLIYFLIFMMLLAALQKTGGTKTGIAWLGFKSLASSAWSGITSFFGFGK